MSDQEPIIKRQSTFPLFSKYFNSHPLDVVQFSISTRKQMQDFIDAFKKRMDAQITYSKNLAQVSKSLDKYIKPGTDLASSFICSAFKVQNQQKSRQALVLAQSIKTQIQTMCTQMLQNHTVFFKKMEKDMKRFYKQGENYQNTYRTALQKYQGINTQMEEMMISKNIMKYTTGIPQQKKARLISKTMQSIKQNKQYQRLYLQAVKDFNSFANIYNNQVKNQLDQAENFIRQQSIMQVDCLRKLIVFEVGMYQSIRHDMLNISKQMQYVDTQKDVQIFTQDYKNNSNLKIISEQNQQKKNKNNIQGLELKKNFGKSLLNQTLQYIQQQYFGWMLANKRNKDLRELIGKVWKVQKIALKKNNTTKQQSKQQLKQNKQQINNEILQKKQETPLNIQNWQTQLKNMIANFKIIAPPNYVLINNKAYVPPQSQVIQKSFLQITNSISYLWNNQITNNEEVQQHLQLLQKYFQQHHLYRLIGYIYIQQFRLQHEVNIPGLNCWKNNGKILKSLIKAAHKNNDTFVIRGILGLLFTFTYQDQKSKKLLFLCPQVYQCQIWKLNQFWQASIFETTYQQMTSFTYQKGQTQAQTILRQKNLIFSQLASYCHYMVMLGITSKNVRLIVGRYCRLYEMSEQQNKDLSKMITNTSKQYKQMNINAKNIQKQNN